MSNVTKLPARLGIHNIDDIIYCSMATLIKKADEMTAAIKEERLSDMLRLAREIGQIEDFMSGGKPIP
jgi:hypothetical protein